MTPQTAQQAQRGDTVRIHYTGQLTNGEVFDSSEGHTPLEFTIGAGQVIAGFDDGVKGMNVGETKRIEIAPEQAYGLADENMIGRFPRAQFNYEQEPQLGDQFAFPLPDGNEIPVTVVAIDDDSITLDGNHPLAGETLIFDLELVGIR